MPESLPPDQTEQSQSSASASSPKTIIPLIKISSKIRLLEVDGKDCCAILEMLKDAAACFDNSLESQSGRTYLVSVEITVANRWV